MTSKQLHDRFSNAEQELEEKNAFVCETCGERRHESELHDRFTDAVSELEEKNAYVCLSCGGKMVSSLEATGRMAKGKGRATGEQHIRSH